MTADLSKATLKATIVGAGPAGLLLAHYLLQRRYQVSLYDRRPDPRQIDADQRRSFPISLQTRGQKAIQGVPGLEAAVANHSLFCQGTVIHNGKKSRDIRRQEKVMAVDRNQMVLTFLEELTARYQAPELTVEFDCTCDRLDSRAQTLTFLDAKDEAFSVSYDRLIGADGANSQIRTQLAERDGFNYEQSYVSDAYKSLFLNRTNLAEGVDLAVDRIHASNINNNTRIILAPQPNDQLHGAFIFDAQNNPLAAFTHPDQIRAYFAENLPTFYPLLSAAEAEALIDRPVARLLTVRCDRFHHGEHILLIGDAIHAVSPSIGQGCNAALQDVEIFNQLLDSHQDDWAKAITQFSELRRADAYALRELSDYSFPRSKPLVAEFFLRLLLSRKLHQWFPQRFKPFLFDQVLETDLAYSKILQDHQAWIDRVKQSMAATE